MKSCRSLVRTGADVFSQPNIKSTEQVLVEPSAHHSEPVRTGLLDVRPEETSSKILEDELRERLQDKNAEIAILRDQLGKSQAEVERRATSTDEALKTIDRVVRSFEMQAEANKALALGGSVASEPMHERTEPIRFTPETVTDDKPDTSSAAEEASSYQHQPLATDKV